MFQSFFIGGFECSTQRGRDGRRHDLIAATRHDELAALDFERLREVNITTAREGLRWPLIETTPNQYDFASARTILLRAQNARFQILWDLFHYGFPDFTNPFAPDFPERLAAFARAFARFYRDESDETLFICPFNEISFFTFAAGERGLFAPYQSGRGWELKRNCVRATVLATKAVREILPDARFMQIEPVVHIVADPQRPHEQAQAESYRTAQFEAWDMLAGHLAPELGGAEDLLDIIGVNFYPHNQWIMSENPAEPRQVIHRGQSLYRPFRQILTEVEERYRRPLFVAETGAEDDERADWLRYVCDETRAARNINVDVKGVCWYPILNHPGWDDDRHCYNGLWDYSDKVGNRQIYEPLAAELHFQQAVSKPAALTVGHGVAAQSAAIRRAR